MPTVTEIEETFCGQTDVWTDGQTLEAHFVGRLTRVDLKTETNTTNANMHP